MSDATNKAAVTFDFSNTVSIVTGSGGGIGQAYVEAIANAGGSVVVADIDTARAEGVAEAIRSNGGDALALRVDVASPESAAEMADRSGIAHADNGGGRSDDRGADPDVDLRHAERRLGRSGRHANQRRHLDPHRR